MTGFQVNLIMRVLHLYVEELRLTTGSNARETLSKRQRIILQVLQEDIVNNLRICLDAYLTQNHLSGGQILQIYRSMAICPGPSLRCDKIPMFARATSNFYGKEWFSSVSMKMEGNNSPERTSYGQLRLLFTSNVQEDEGTNITKELYLVRMYDEVGFDSRVYCPILKW